MTEETVQRTFELADEEATLQLGRDLAAGLSQTTPEQVLLLEGNLGAGKTTLVRGLVTAMEDGDEARVSSPSFNIMNLYPTNPETAHFDLYRLEGMPPDDMMLEYLHCGEMLVIVEWSQYLAEEFMPGEYLHFKWQECTCGRKLLLTAAGKKAKETLYAIKR